MVSKLPEHTVSRYEQELEQLRSMILRMFGMVENQFSKMILVLNDCESEIAYKIALQDIEIDDYERMIDVFSIRILALRSPMAIDLREIVSSFKISVELERIGNLIADICRHIHQVNIDTDQISLAGLVTMGRQVQENLRQLVITLTVQDKKKLLHLWNTDNLIDELNLSVFNELTKKMTKNTDVILACSHLLCIAKNLERIGDHLTSIIRNYYYIFTGDMLPYKCINSVSRAKGTV